MMALPLSSRSTQIGIQKRFPVIEFEPLLDAIEAAALLRMHPKTLKKKACLGEIPGRHVGKYWRFRVSDLNDWLWRQERGGYGARAHLSANGARTAAVCCREAGQRIVSADSFGAPPIPEPGG
jgi:excisionase family DNA binding protein